MIASKLITADVDINLFELLSTYACQYYHIEGQIWSL